MLVRVFIQQYISATYIIVDRNIKRRIIFDLTRPLETKWNFEFEESRVALDILDYSSPRSNPSTILFRRHCPREYFISWCNAMCITSVWANSINCFKTSNIFINIFLACFTARRFRLSEIFNVLNITKIQDQEAVRNFSRGNFAGNWSKKPTWENKREFSVTLYVFEYFLCIFPPCIEN